MKEIDALIIGKGPAGIQASLYIHRSNYKTLVIGKDLGASEKAHLVDNYYGLVGMSGSEIVEKGIKQAQDLGIEVVSDEVVKVEFDGEYYVVTTANEVYKTISLLIASGAHRNIPRIRKIRNFEGRGVSYCAVCDGFFFKNKRIGVIGAMDYAAHEAEYLMSISEEVTIFLDGEAKSGEFHPKLNIVSEKVTEVFGDDKVGGVIAGDETYELDGIFVAVGSASSSDLAASLGVMMERDKIMVDSEQATNLPGLYAAGDCTPGVLQIAKAVGDGCVAGMSMSSYIRNFKRQRSE